MQIDSYLSSAMLVLAGTLFGIAGLLLTRKILTLEQLEKSHTVGGAMLAVAATMYAVLLGLIVVDAMQKFEEARVVTEREAACLVNIYINAGGLSEPHRSQLRTLCRDYSEAVINSEWPQMDEGSFCPVAQKTVISLMKGIAAAVPNDSKEQTLYQQIVSDSSQLWQLRRERISTADTGIPMAEWIVLLTGAVITVFFTYMFGLENLQLQIVMTGLVAMLISLNLVLLLYFGYPFSGDVCVHSDSFRLDLNLFDNKVVENNGVLECPTTRH